MKRRNFLAGTAASVGVLASAPASAQDGTPTDVAAAVAHIRASIPANFDHDYVERVVIPFSLTAFIGWRYGQPVAPKLRTAHARTVSRDRHRLDNP